jgi:hypothetical protein
MRHMSNKPTVCTAREMHASPRRILIEYKFAHVRVLFLCVLHEKRKRACVRSSECRIVPHILLDFQNPLCPDTVPATRLRPMWACRTSKQTSTDLPYVCVRFRVYGRARRIAATFNILSANTCITHTTHKSQFDPL